MTFKETKMKLYVARHGQTDWNSENRVCGSTNRPLTDLGKEQAKALAENMKDKGIDVIIASPMMRAMQTAGAVSLSTGIPVMMDDRLREHDYGTFEGIDRSKDEYWQQKYQFAAKFPQGESVLQLAQRVYNLLDDVKKAYPDKTVLLVCHGGVSRMIKTYFEDMTNDEFFHYSPENAFVAEYEM